MNYLPKICVWRKVLGVLIGTLINISISISALANFDIFEPTSSYEHIEVEGWAVRVSNDYSSHPQKRKLILNETRHQLKAINWALPKSALSKLKRTVFWIEYQNRPKKGASYHPSRDWLIKNEYFAELSESYSGYNDCEPFDRSALKIFDPVGFKWFKPFGMIRKMAIQI